MVCIRLTQQRDNNMSAQLQSNSRPLVEDTNDRFGPFLHCLQLGLARAITDNIAKNQWPDNRVRIGYSSVSGDDMYKLYLASFSTKELRQEHTCNCCKNFFRNYGNLVLIDRDGHTRSLFWNEGIEGDTPSEYAAFLDSARHALGGTKVERLFFFNTDYQSQVGMHERGGYDHFCFHLQRVMPRTLRTRTGKQNAAEYAEDLRLFKESMANLDLDILRQLKVQFENDENLSRTSFAPIVPDFLAIVENYRAIKEHNLRANYLVAKLTTCRKGLARIGQTVLGEFIKELTAGVDMKTAKANFLRRIDPKDYMRPKAAPSSQTVVQAERIVAELGIADSLRRRSLRRDELPQGYWTRPAPKPSEGGVFGAVPTKDSRGDGLPEIDGGRVSLTTLMSKIRAGAVKVEINIRNYPSTMFSSLVTEAVAGAKPILHWDREENRNPVSSYKYASPVYPHQWGLQTGWQEVLAIVDRPENWGKVESGDEDYLFVFANGRDTASPNLPLFPETLRPELHQVRAVIEGYAQMNKLEGTEQGLVAWHYSTEQIVRVTTAEAAITYAVVSLK